MNIYSYPVREEVIRMPNRDKTGPNNQGKLTGRGLGPCSGNQIPFGRGFGRGRCWNVRAPLVELSKEEQINILKGQQKGIEVKIKELTQE